MSRGVPKSWMLVLDKLPLSRRLCRYLHYNCISCKILQDKLSKYFNSHIPFSFLFVIIGV